MTKPKRVKWVAVFETHIPEEAHIIAGKLDEADVANVINGDTTRAFGFLIGRGARIEVLVDAADFLRAQELLNEVENHDDPAE